ESQDVPVVSHPHAPGLVCGLEDVVVSTVVCWVDRYDSVAVHVTLLLHLQEGPHDGITLALPASSADLSATTSPVGLIVGTARPKPWPWPPSIAEALSR
ncbi:unnamed protein product, partial [Laminaria digitata]